MALTRPQETADYFWQTVGPIVLVIACRSSSSGTPRPGGELRAFALSVLAPQVLRAGSSPEGGCGRCDVRGRAACLLASRLGAGCPTCVTRLVLSGAAGLPGGSRITAMAAAAAAMRVICEPGMPPVRMVSTRGGAFPLSTGPPDGVVHTRVLGRGSAGALADLGCSLQRSCASVWCWRRRSGEVCEFFVRSWRENPADYI